MMEIYIPFIYISWWLGGYHILAGSFLSQPNRYRAAVINASGQQGYEATLNPSSGDNDLPSNNIQQYPTYLQL